MIVTIPQPEAGTTGNGEPIQIAVDLSQVEAIRPPRKKRAMSGEATYSNPRLYMRSGNEFPFQRDYYEFVYLKWQSAVKSIMVYSAKDVDKIIQQMKERREEGNQAPHVID